MRIVHHTYNSYIYVVECSPVETWHTISQSRTSISVGNSVRFPQHLVKTSSDTLCNQLMMQFRAATHPHVREPMGAVPAACVGPSTAAVGAADPISAASSAAPASRADAGAATVCTVLSDAAGAAVIPTYSIPGRSEYTGAAPAAGATSARISRESAPAAGPRSRGTPTSAAPALAPAHDPRRSLL